MLAIAREAAGQPELLKEAPHVRPVKRLDEVQAAKQPVVRYRFEQHEDPQGAGEARQLEAQKGALAGRSELPTSRGDVAAAGQADSRWDAAPLQLGLEGGNRLRRGPREAPGRVVRDQVHLEDLRDRAARQATRACSTRSFTPASITYSTKTLRRRSSK